MRDARWRAAGASSSGQSFARESRSTALSVAGHAAADDATGRSRAPAAHVERQLRVRQQRSGAACRARMNASLSALVSGLTGTNTAPANSTPCTATANSTLFSRNTTTRRRVRPRRSRSTCASERAPSAAAA